MALRQINFEDLLSTHPGAEPFQVDPELLKGDYEKFLDTSKDLSQRFSAPLDAVGDVAASGLMAAPAGLAGLGAFLSGPAERSEDARLQHASDTINNVMNFGQSGNPYWNKVSESGKAVIPNLISGTASMLQGSQRAYKEGEAEINARMPQATYPRPDWVKAVNKKMDAWNESTQQGLDTFLESTKDYWGGVAQEHTPKFPGSFVENPSVERAASALMQGGVSLTSAVGLTALFGPEVAIGFLSLGESGGIRDEALAHDKTEKEAFQLSAKAAILTGLLEKYGLDSVLKANGSAGKRFLTGFVGEAGTEDAQQLVQNAIKKHGYDESVGYLDGIIESTIAGAVGGPIAMANTSTSPPYRGPVKPQAEVDEQGGVDEQAEVDAEAETATTNFELIDKLGKALTDDQRTRAVEVIATTKSVAEAITKFPAYKTKALDAYAVALAVTREAATQEVEAVEDQQVAEPVAAPAAEPAYDLSVIQKLLTGEGLTNDDLEVIAAIPKEIVQEEFARLKAHEEFMKEWREGSKLRVPEVAEKVAEAEAEAEEVVAEESPEAEVAEEPEEVSTLEVPTEDDGEVATTTEAELDVATKSETIPEPELSAPLSATVSAVDELEELGAELMVKRGEKYWKHTLSNGKVLKVPVGRKTGPAEALQKIQTAEAELQQLAAIPAYASVVEAKADGYIINPRSFNDLTTAKHFAESIAKRDNVKPVLIKVGKKLRVATKELSDAEEAAAEDELYEDTGPDEEYEDDDVALDINKLGKLVDDLEATQQTYGNKIAKGELETLSNDAISKKLRRQVLSPEELEEAQAAIDMEVAETERSYHSQLHSLEDLDGVESGEYVGTARKVVDGIWKAVEKLNEDERGAVGRDISDLKKTAREVKEALALAKRREKRLKTAATDVVASALGTAAKRAGSLADAPTEEGLSIFQQDLKKLAALAESAAVEGSVQRSDIIVETKGKKAIALTAAEEKRAAAIIQRRMEIELDRAFTGKLPAVEQYYKFLRARGRIVPEYLRGSYIMPNRAKPIIAEHAPKLLDPNADMKLLFSKVGDSRTTKGHVMSPSTALRPFFAPGDHPVVDLLECGMVSGRNRSNDFRWKKDIFGMVPSAKGAIKKTLGPLYKKAKKRLEVSEQHQARYARLSKRMKEAQDVIKLNTSRLENVSVTHPRRDLFIADMRHAENTLAKLKAMRKKLKKQSVKYAKTSKRMLVMEYDRLLPGLAKAHASVRIALSAGDALPIGVEISDSEKLLARQLRGYFEKTREDLRALGFSVLESRAYMSHSYGELMTDRWAQKFNYEPAVPTRFKFLYQSPRSRIWIPDLHMILDNYIPMVNRKLALQPFLNRWSDFIEYQAPPHMRGMLIDWLKANVYQQHGGIFHTIANGWVALEYLRLVGGSLSIPVKHATKFLDTFATNTTGQALKGVHHTVKAGLQQAGRAAGIKGENVELKVLKTFVSMDQIVRMMDESPGASIAWRLAKVLSGALTTFTELVDNGTTIFAGIGQAAKAGLSMEQTHKLIWDNICKANFRGGPDQPLYMKHPAGRILGMFQTTVQKLFELRAGLVFDFVKGGKDVYSNSKRMQLFRYTLLWGALIGLARHFDKDLIAMLLEIPYFHHWIYGSEDPNMPYKLAEPKTPLAPPIQLVAQMARQGVGHGLVDHFGYTPIYKYLTMWDNRYPNSYYLTPIDQLFGLKRLDAGHQSYRAPTRQSSGGRKGRSGR
jgi:hypothetical protein